MAHDRRLTVYGASPDMDGEARVGRLSGYEHLPPVSVPFRHFLSRLTCWAPAQRRSLGAKNSRKLPAHRCFAVSAEQIWAEARRRLQGILLYFQGLERSISPNLPAKTGRGSNPLSLALRQSENPVDSSRQDFRFVFFILPFSVFIIHSRRQDFLNGD